MFLAFIFHLTTMNLVRSIFNQFEISNCKFISRFLIIYLNFILLIFLTVLFCNIYTYIYIQKKHIILNILFFALNF